MFQRLQMLISTVAVVGAVFFCMPHKTIAGGIMDPTINYEVQPLFTKGLLTALKVVMRLQSDRDGQTVIKLPKEYGGETDLYMAFGNPTVSGGHVERSDDPSEVVIKSDSLSSIVLTYEIAVPPGAKDSDWPTSIFTFKDLRPTSFRVLGPTVFSTVKGRDNGPVAFSWLGPKDWTFVSDLQYLRADATQSDLVQSVLAGGQSVRVSKLRPDRVS